MSSRVSIVARQTLNGRSAETVERLFAAAEEELELVGHEALTIRSVAQRAGCAPATAYTYLASKDHLFAELFWHRLVAHPGAEPPPGTAAERLSHTMRHLAAVIAGAPAVAAAATRSLLGSDPHVAPLRTRIGALFVDRFRVALGEGGDPRVLEVVSLAFFGALLHTGMGLLSLDELGDRLADVVALVAGDRP